MLARLKRILLRQYIGALVTAFVAAQGIASVISVIMMPITHYFLIAGRAPTGFFGEKQSPPLFNWNQLIVGLVTICLQFGVVSGLMWWLFYEQTGAEQTEPSAGA